MRCNYLIALLVLIGCAHNRNPASGEHQRGVDLNQLNSESEIHIKLTSGSKKGHFLGTSKKGRTETVEVDVCTFNYHKKSEDQLRYETVQLRFAGKGKGKPVVSDSISYSNTDMVDNFRPWNLKETFGPIKLKGPKNYNDEETLGTLTYYRKKNTTPLMVFRHQTEDSENTRKNYVVKLELSKKDLALDLAKLMKATVVVTTQEKSFFGSYSEPVSVTNVTCSNFQADTGKRRLNLKQIVAHAFPRDLKCIEFPLETQRQLNKIFAYLSPIFFHNLLRYLERYLERPSEIDHESLDWLF
jgi:hypothetical protein